MSIREYEMVLKAMADPTRVRILKLLEAGELCVCQVVAVLELSQGTISKHLSILKKAGLVKERQERKWVYYTLDGTERSLYAEKMVATLGDWLNDDPIVARDRKREALARKLGPVNICDRGMTLPSRQSRSCCPSPRKLRNNGSGRPRAELPRNVKGGIQGGKG